MPARLDRSLVAPFLRRCRRLSVISRDKGLDVIDPRLRGGYDPPRGERTAHLLPSRRGRPPACAAKGPLVTAALACVGLDFIRITTYNTIGPLGRSQPRVDARGKRRNRKICAERLPPPFKLVLGVPANGHRERVPGLVRAYFELVDNVIAADGGNGNGNGRCGGRDKDDCRPVRQLPGRASIWIRRTTSARGWIRRPRRSGRGFHLGIGTG